MSPETLNAALDAWHRGEPARDIAARLGVGADLLRAYVSRARKSGDPRAVLRKQGQKPDPTRREVYAAAHADGLTVRQAADRLGLTAGGVRAMWRKMGLI